MDNTCTMHNSKAATCMLLGLSWDRVSHLSRDGAWNSKVTVQPELPIVKQVLSKVSNPS